MNDVKSVLVLAPNWVGDTLFFLPAVAALRKRFPGARFTLVAKKGLCELHGANPLFDFRAPLPGGRTRNFCFLWALRERAFDLAVVFPDSFSSALGAWFSGAQERLGRSKQGRGPLLTIPVTRPDNDRQRHVAREYMDLALAAGAPDVPEDLEARLPLTGASEIEREILLGDAGLKDGEPLVALCPTSAFGPAKCWPAEYFAGLAVKLMDSGLKPVLFGAPSEKVALQRVADLAGRPVPMLFPTLPGLAACLAKMKCVVANDSGSLHVAAAVGAPVVGLYGPISPKWSSPLTRASRIFYTGIACSPCHQRVCPLKHHKCLRDIQVDEVFKAVRELAP